MQVNRQERQCNCVKLHLWTQPSSFKFLESLFWPGLLLRVPHPMQDPMFARPVPIPNRDLILLTLIFNALNYIYLSFSFLTV
jgi:hypothetical protein